MSNKGWKTDKLKDLCQSLKTSLMELSRLKAQIGKLNEKEGVEIEEELHDDLCSIMQQETVILYQNFQLSKVFLGPADSGYFQEAQQWQWHPIIIKWCLHLNALSSAAYRAPLALLPCLLNDYVIAATILRPDLASQRTSSSKSLSNLKTVFPPSTGMFNPS